MSERENKKACIGIDVSKGSSHFQAFYCAGVPASEPIILNILSVVFRTSIP